MGCDLFFSEKPKAAQNDLFAAQKVKESQQVSALSVKWIDRLWSLAFCCGNTRRIPCIVSTSWNIQELQLPLLPEFYPDRVLLEHDGPQMVTVRDQEGQLFLGVAVDESPDVVRWLYSPISELELDALFLGAVATRDALLKDQVWIVDERPDGAKLQAWSLAGENIPPDALPGQGVFLPRSVQRTFAPKTDPRVKRGF